MIVVIDTSSLLSLVRYYVPFDNNSILFDFIKRKIEKKEIIIIDEVLNEAKYMSKGLVLDTLMYLKDKSYLKLFQIPLDTEFLIPPQSKRKRFMHLLRNDFVNSIIKKNKKLDDTEFENQIDRHIKGADVKQIILCLNLLEENNKVALITEETENPNDDKLFVKIPAMCKSLDIPTYNLPDALKAIGGINFSFSIEN